jgi:DNA/RNA-binding domain of Phe-tRNA-synthetase-like protein
MFEPTSSWKSTFPGAHAGVLAVRNVTNPARHAELEQKKAALEQELRGRFAGQERSQLIAAPVLQAYEAYYKRFKKTYSSSCSLSRSSSRASPSPAWPRWSRPCSWPN